MYVHMYVCSCRSKHPIPFFSPIQSLPLFQLFCLALPPQRETNCSTFQPPVDLSFRSGHQVGGRTLCWNVRPSPGSQASVSSQAGTKVAFCSFRRSQTTAPSLSFLRAIFYGIPVGWEQRQSVSGLWPDTPSRLCLCVCVCVRSAD